MAISLIRDCIWVNDTLVTGTYVYKNQIIDFKYDLKDQRYRIHSHVWMQLLYNYKYDGSLEIFDLVSNFDILEYPHFKMEPKQVQVEPLYIEPIIVFGDPHNIYSVIGPFCEVKVGLGSRIHTPYMNGSFESLDGDLECYQDITSFVELEQDFSAFKFQDEMYLMEKGEPLDDRFYFKKKDNKRYVMFRRIPDQVAVYSYINNKKQYMDMMEEFEQNEDQIVTRSNIVILNSQIKMPKKMGYKLQKKMVQLKEDYRNFWYFKRTELKFLSFPKNRNFGLVYDFQCLKILDAIEMQKKDLHSFFPLFIPRTGLEGKLEQFTQYSKEVSSLITDEWDDMCENVF